jgi:hypothetical protein
MGKATGLAASAKTGRLKPASLAVNTAATLEKPARLSPFTMKPAAGTPESPADEFTSALLPVKRLPALLASPSEDATSGSTNPSDAGVPLLLPVEFTVSVVVSVTGISLLPLLDLPELVLSMTKLVGFVSPTSLLPDPLPSLVCAVGFELVNPVPV